MVAGKAYEQGSAVAGKALEGAKKYAGPYGEKAQGFVGCECPSSPLSIIIINFSIESDFLVHVFWFWTAYQGPFFYNLSVAREFLKQVYIRESLAPPKTLSEVQAAYKSLWEQASNPQWWKTTLDNGHWKKVGIYALEAYGIFHIGEMVGRRSIVGYNLK